MFGPRALVTYCYTWEGFVVTFRDGQVSIFLGRRLNIG